MKYVTLEEVCENRTSNISQKDLKGNEGIYPIYGASGLIKKVDFYIQDKEYIGIVKDGAGVGRTMLLPSKSSVIGTMQYIIPNGSLNIKYLYYALISKKLSKYSSGATIPHIYFRDYKKEKILLISEIEQQKIVSILDNIVSLIEKNKKRIILLEELVKSRFIEMFGDPIKNDKGWKKEKLLENVVEKVENISKNSEIIISYIDISSINNLKNRIETYKNYYIDEAPSRAKKIINRNDILMSTVRPNLKNIALFDIETENKAIASTGFCILRTKTKLNTLYLFNVLLSNSFTNELSKKEIGANYPAVTENDIKNVKIALPPLTLQNEFAEFVTKTDKLKFRLFSLIILGENLLKNLTLLIFLDNIRLVLELDKRNKNKN